jgi:Na+/proline symporter
MMRALAETYAVDVPVVSFMIPYLVLNLALGLYASRHTKTLKDFVLAGRTLPFFVTITSMFAMFFGAETTLGASYNMAASGLSGDVIADPYGGALCLILYGAVYALPLYKTNNLTLSDFYVERYGAKLGVFSAIINTIGYLLWTAGQIVGLGLISSRTWGVPKEVGSLICTGIVVIYTFRGGMYAVAWTECFESVVIVICLIVMAVEVGASTGLGWSEAYTRFDERMEPDPEASSRGLASLNFIALWFYLGIGSVPSQDIYERMNSASRSEYARFGAIIAGVLYIMVAQIPMYIGLVARSQYNADNCAGDVLGCAGVDISELDEGVILDTINELVSPGVRVVFYAAFISAVLSTASGTMLGAGVLITINIVRPALPNVPDAQILLISRVATVAFALAAYAFTFFAERISDFVNVSSVWLMVGLFFPLTFGLFWKGATAVGAGFSMLVGTVSYTILFAIARSDATIGDGDGFLLYELDTSLWAMFFAFAAFLVGSLMPARWQDAINGAMERALGWIPLFQNRANSIIKVDQDEGARGSRPTDVGDLKTVAPKLGDANVAVRA